MFKFNPITSIVLASALGMSLSARAVQCETDQDCFAAGLGLIKKANKLGTCSKEVKAAGEAISKVAVKGPALESLETCVLTTAYQAKVTKRNAKRIERLQKALEAPAASRDPSSVPSDDDTLSVRRKKHKGAKLASFQGRRRRKKA